MRLLVVTQAVDESDVYLSFFTQWLTALASRFDSVEVICLKEGAHSLPANVHVHSLGKERGATRVHYVLRFLSYIWTLRSRYDAAFVHMNQEYVLIGGWVFALLEKPLYLWRNHYAGSLFTDLAALFCKKVFYTSRFSYTAKFDHSVRMPVGVDTKRFRNDSAGRVPRSVLFFARFAPSKRPDVFVRALALLHERQVPFTATVVGSPLAADEAYEREVHALARELHVEQVVTFKPGVPNTEAPHVFSAADIFVDLGASGMYNKMIFEAAASGCLVLAASRDFQDEMGREFGFDDGDDRMIASRIETMLSYTDQQRADIVSRLHEYTERNSLETLCERLQKELI